MIPPKWSNDVRFRVFLVERCPILILFDFSGHCSNLFNFARLCSTIPDIVQFFSTLSEISRSVLSYNETRTSFDCFCQIICQKPQPGQPPNLIEIATKMSIVDSCSLG